MCWCCYAAFFVVVGVGAVLVLALFLVLALPLPLSLFLALALAQASPPGRHQRRSHSQQSMGAAREGQRVNLPIASQHQAPVPGCEEGKNIGVEGECDEGEEGGCVQGWARGQGLGC